ncbi:MAG: class I SAM-dependent methyltransferase [Oligoflexales bacterium]
MKDYKFFLRIFFVGAKYGILNLLQGGVRTAGLKRSLGFILQPVENWSRYPEFLSVYRLMPASSSTSSILDLGSPKMFGIFLADERSGNFALTDIWPVAVDEFRTIAQIANKIGKGKVTLRVEDATQLRSIPDNSLDHVYSVSVLEHIKEREGTLAAVKEVQRVLKPGGIFTLSMPVASAPRDEFKTESIYKEEFQG